MRGKITRGEYALSRIEAVSIVKSADYGVLATVNAKGEPSVVALNHVMINDHTLIFHGRSDGEKIKNIKQNPNVSFFVIADAELVAERFTTVYKSAVAHGIAVIVEKDNKKREYANALMNRFVGNLAPERLQKNYIAKELPRVSIIEMTIQHLTAKAGS
ncbi:MAG: hypothetical protein GX969_01130 [Firmicutes bacterium]|nr:hypothetical protein [Bacillota bacterium]